MRSALAFCLCLPLLALGACSSAMSGKTAAAKPSNTNAVAMDLDAGTEPAGCAAAIAKYRTVIDNDKANGQVNAAVAKDIDLEIAKAQGVCRAGYDAESMRMLRASKARHGYPIGG